MTDKGLKKLKYVLESHYPWQPGRNVLSNPSLPSWLDEHAVVVNRAIAKVVYEPR